MFDDFEIIHRYTRAEAIADGVLVDATAMAKEAGFRYPVALTQAVWEKYVKVPPGVEAQDEAGRLWDVLWMLRYAIDRSQSDDTLLFQLHVRNNNAAPALVTLKAVCHADDDGQPCLTILLPDED